MSTEIRSALLILFSAVLSLAALTACTYDALVRVDEEGEAEIQIIIAVDDFFLNLVPDGETPLTDLVDEIEQQTIFDEGPFEGAHVELYEQDGLFGFRMTAPFNPRVFSLSEFFDNDSPFGLLGDMSSIGEYEFERTENDDGWIFLIEQPIESDPLANLGDMLEGSDLEGFDIPSPTLTFRLDLPGEIIKHNADREDGDILVWDIDPSEDISISAVSRDSSDFPNIASIAIAATFALILIGIIVAVTISRRRERQALEVAEAGDE